MELGQPRFFVTVVGFGSRNRAAAQLGVVPAVLAQDIGRLEGELALLLDARQLDLASLSDDALSRFALGSAGPPA